MRTKFTAALAALALTIGGLALAGPAFAQEVAPSPDTLVGLSPTSPSSTTEASSDSTTPTSTTVTPPSTESADASAPPTGDSAVPGSKSAETPSSPTSADTTDAASPSEPQGATPGPTTSPASSDSPTVSSPTTLASNSSFEGASTSTPAADVSIGEVSWAMPNGGTPQNVTWPQTLAHNPECGVWYQVDLYPVDAIPALVADGILTLGEDYPVVISWRFVYGGECQPDAIVETGEWTDQAFACGDTTTEQTRTVTTTPYVLVEDEWVPGDTATVTETQERDLTPAEVTVCPVVTPTPTPSVAPTVTPSAAPVVAPVVAETVSVEQLASTGSDEGGKAVILLVAVALIALGIVTVAILRRRIPKQK